MDDLLKPPRNRFGEATGTANERQMLARHPTDASFTTDTRTEVDGSKLLMRTHGGFVRFIKEPAKKQKNIVLHRGFGAFTFLVSGAVKTFVWTRLINWVKTTWKRVKNQSKYFDAINYRSVRGRASPRALRLPPGVQKIEHLGSSRYHDIAVLGKSASGQPAFVVNMCRVRKLPFDVFQEASIVLPVVLPVVQPVVPPNETAHSNTYPTGYDDTKCYHLFLVSLHGVRHIAPYDIAASATYDLAPLAATIPEVAQSFGETLRVDDVSQTITLFGVRSTFSGSSPLTLFYWRAVLAYGATSPYLEVAAETVVQRPFYTYMDMSAGALTNLSESSSWDNYPSVPSLPVFDYFTHSVTNNGDNTWTIFLHYEGTAYGPTRSFPGNGSTSTWTFSNTKNASSSHIIADGKTLVTSRSITLNYQLQDGSGACYLTYDGGAPNYSVINAGTGVFGSDNGQEPLCSQFIGQQLSQTGAGAKKTYTNMSSLVVSHNLDGTSLFSMNGTLSYIDTTASGWSVSSYGMQGVSTVDGHENGTYPFDPGQVPGQAMYSGGYIPFSGSFIENYSNPVEQTTYDEHTFTASTTLNATCRDYIYRDEVNNVEIYLEGTFSGSNSDFRGTATGVCTLQVDVVVIAHGAEIRKNLFTQTQPEPHHLGYEIVPYVQNADFSPTHLLAPTVYNDLR